MLWAKRPAPAARRSDLAGLPVFYERWTLGAPTLFDYPADFVLRASLEQHRTLAGCCNLHGVPAGFALTSPNVRESLIASDCGSSTRQRALAAAISWALFGDAFSSLAASAEWLEANGKRVFLAESRGPLHATFAAALPPARFVASEYLGPAVAPGALRGGVRHEDLERLSFPDASFDLVITADVMEHVADAPRAEREIVRVLRPGGVYCFTIPFYFDLEHDRVRALPGAEGTVRHLEEPQYHEDPVRAGGALVFRDYAESDLRARFGALGCAFEIVRVWSPTLAMLGGDLVVMVVRRLH
ncbi:MAG TPA: methyltransferase domain-containing protein [Candidatus Elarobacter sp.]|nr:methyltransferase domain-containing protein [Candidatus Elarobacter sp.]